MRATPAILVLPILLCGCFFARPKARAELQIAETRSLIEQLILERVPSAETSNKLLRLKDTVVPILLESVSSLNYEDQKELSKVAAACRILGTNAEPVFHEIAKGLASENPPRRAGASLILIGAGPSAFGAIIQFSKAQVNLPEPGLIKQHILYPVEVFPKESVTELVRLYHATQKCPEVKEFIKLAFQESLTTNECRLLIPVFKPLLPEEDSFIVLTILDFAKRCGSLANGIKDEVNRLLMSSDPKIRLEATNAMRSISGMP